MSNGVFNLDKLDEIEAKLDSIDEINKDKTEKKDLTTDKIKGNIELVLERIASDKSEDVKWGKDYLKLNASLEEINTAINDLFTGTLTDEALDDVFSLQEDIYGQEYTLGGGAQGRIDWHKTHETEPKIFPNIAAGDYTSGETTQRETAGGWGLGEVSGERKYKFSDEDLYLSYAQKILSDENLAGSELQTQAQAFLNYVSGKNKLEELGGRQMPHYVIPPGEDWKGITRVSPKEFNVGGVYGGHLYEPKHPGKNTLWDFPKMRDLEFVKKHGATSGIFGGGDPIEDYAKGGGLKGKIFEEWFSYMGDAYQFAQYVQQDFSQTVGEYDVKRDQIIGVPLDEFKGDPDDVEIVGDRAYDSTSNIAYLQDGTEVNLDELRQNMDILHKLYGDKEGVLKLLQELSETNK